MYNTEGTEIRNLYCVPGLYGIYSRADDNLLQLRKGEVVVDFGRDGICYPAMDNKKPIIMKFFPGKEEFEVWFFSEDLEYKIVIKGVLNTYVGSARFFGEKGFWKCMELHGIEGICWVRFYDLANTGWRKLED